MAGNDELALAQIRLDAEVKKAEARWGFWKVVIGTGLVGIAAAFFPFAQQLATLHFEAEIETAKAEAQLKTQEKQLAFDAKQHDRAALKEAKEFLQEVSKEERAKSLGERIVLAEYFVYLSDSDAERKKWEHFLQFLNAKQAAVVEAQIDAAKIAGSDASPQDVAVAEEKAKALRESAGVYTNQSGLVAPGKSDEAALPPGNTPFDPVVFNRMLSWLLAKDGGDRGNARSALAEMGPNLVQPAMAQLAAPKLAYRLRLGLLVALTEMMRNNKGERQRIIGLLSEADLAILLDAAIDYDRTIRIHAGEFLFDLGDPRAFKLAAGRWTGGVSDNGRFNLALVMKGAAPHLASAPDVLTTARDTLLGLKGTVGPKTDQLLDEAIALLP